MNDPARIAVIGDLHGHWDDWDARYFAASDYALLVFTGDLGSGGRDDGVRIARSIARANKPALVMPGNNDVHSAPQIAAELGHQSGLRALLRIGAQAERASEQSEESMQLCGYSAHALPVAGREITLLAARPYARGGGELSFPEALARSHDVHTMEQSAVRLCALVEGARTRDLIILAHNGPTGLGTRATDLWGCDFEPAQGDWGDPDLTEMIAHARACDKRVLAVIAGHMHSPTRAGERRIAQCVRNETLYLNPAIVPRIAGDARGVHRHHVRLEIDREGLCARDVVVHEAD